MSAGVPSKSSTIIGWPLSSKFSSGWLCCFMGELLDADGVKTLHTCLEVLLEVTKLQWDRRDS